jgi:hypothetical protein
MFRNQGELDAFIRTIVPPNKFVLVSTGNLARSAMPSIHNLEKIHSVYIFCRNVSLHKEWSEPYKKVRGVFSDSKLLQAIMRAHLAEEVLDGNVHIIASERQPVLTPAEAGRLFCFHVNAYEKRDTFSIDVY